MNSVNLQPCPNFVKNKLEVWHHPQVPCKPYRVPVKDEIEAFKIMTVLADQHLWLFENNIIPDYSNAIEVIMWDGNEWISYWNEQEQMEWDEFEQTYLND